MSDQKSNESQHFTDWLSGEVQLRVPRKILLLGALAVLLLLGIALD